MTKRKKRPSIRKRFKPLLIAKVGEKMYYKLPKSLRVKGINQRVTVKWIDMKTRKARVECKRFTKTVSLSNLSFGKWKDPKKGVLA